MDCFASLAMTSGVYPKATRSLRRRPGPADEALHLARIEQAMGIDLGFEPELIGVGATVAAAVLQCVDMRIGDEDAVRLVGGDDLVEPLGALVAHDGQGAGGDMAGIA